MTIVPRCPANLICIACVLALTLPVMPASAANGNDDRLNLPADFQQLIADRATIDRYHQTANRVEAGAGPAPVRPTMSRLQAASRVRLVQPQLSPATLAYRSSLTQLKSFPRGFQAPILDEADNWSALQDRSSRLSPAETAAAKLVDARLAYDGLLFTLAQALELLPAPAGSTNQLDELLRLRAIGFPADLLACFAPGDQSDSTTAALAVVQLVSRRLAEGASASQLKSELESLPFRWPAAWSTFEIASESGEHEPGLMRLQAGGGYVDGIVPGHSINVISQLVTGFPQINFLLSVPSTFAVPIQHWAVTTLPLTRRNQLTLVVEPFDVEAWAQDNGKAGTLMDPATGRRIWATLTPRYASRNEGDSKILHHESFLMDGLVAAGHRVVQFPLLFQGGNLLPVTEPKSGRRRLLVGEGVLRRNASLGLSAGQILTAFREGLGVDECIPVNALSYHLDYDISVRRVDDELVAFVNDPRSAVRLVLGLGIDAFERRGLLPATAAADLRYDLAGNDGRRVHQALTSLVRSGVQADAPIPNTTASLFKASPLDSAVGNLEVFLQALDLLESAGGADPGDADPERREYLGALRRMEQARLDQVATLKALGWQVTPVPSMPNLYRSINYLNGVHHRSGYVLPTFGGFYAPLDEAAANAFRFAIGSQLNILPIQCAELQRMQGAVHCVAVMFPKLEEFEAER